MTRRIFSIAATVFLLAVATIGAWFVTERLQRIPGIDGTYAECWSREGNAAQISCLSDEFEGGAAKAVAGLTGSKRDARLLDYVRSVEGEASSDPRLGGSCHPAMHELGRTEGKRAATGGTPPQFPSGSSQLCTAGYVHGLAEGYLTGTKEADVAAVFPKLCHATKAREGCAHGIGHALIRARVDDRASIAADASTRRCSELPFEFPTNCMNGAYMELAMRARPDSIAPADYVEACRRVEEDVDRSFACWGYLTLNLTTNDVPISKTPNWCAKADLPGQFTCIEQYGRALGVDKMDGCSTSAELKLLKQRCIDGAVGLQVGSGHVTTAEAHTACEVFDDRSLRDHCTGAIERYTRGRERVSGNA